MPKVYGNENSEQVKGFFLPDLIRNPSSSGSVPDSLTSAQLNRLQLLLSRFSLARDPTTAAALADPYLGQSIGPVPGYGVSVSSHYVTGRSRSTFPQLSIVTIVR